MSRVIAVANQKGGVGKTTTAVNLSACLADAGKKTLAIDIDPQGNATSGLGVDKRRLRQSVYDCLIDEAPMKSVAMPTNIRNLSLVPANPDLAGAEVEMVPMIGREYKLKNALEPVRNSYDYIIIDCPPSLGLLTINALTAADSVIVPIQCEYYALEGLGQLMETFRLVQARLNKALSIEGVVLTMFDGRTNLSLQVVDEVKKFFKDKVYSSVIPRTVRLSEAPSHGKPIILYDPRSKGSEVYKELTGEVILRAEERAGKGSAGPAAGRTASQ
jgi:chromosome partitioning protein